MPRMEKVRAADWRRWTAENDALVLDVRETHEWATGTLPGAVRMSLGTIPNRLAELDPSRPLLVVCRSGSRSAMAAKFLAERGFRAANLAGGMVAIGNVR